MGIVTQGPPRDILVRLARENGCTVFVETGTFRGETTRWAASTFGTVHTIERAEQLYEKFSPELNLIKGVQTHFGDSRDVLPKVIEQLDNELVVYWLDGHWSAGETAGENDECPLLDELACLADRIEDIILIDDARCFLSAPPPPNNPEQWPTIADIVNVLPDGGRNQIVQVIDDVIFIVPDKGLLKRMMVDYAQKRSEIFWGQAAKQFSGSGSLWSSLKKLTK